MVPEAEAITEGDIIDKLTNEWSKNRFKLVKTALFTLRCWLSDARSVALQGPVSQTQLKSARQTAKRGYDGVYSTQ